MYTIRPVIHPLGRQQLVPTYSRHGYCWYPVAITLPVSCNSKVISWYPSFHAPVWTITPLFIVPIFILEYQIISSDNNFTYEFYDIYKSNCYICTPGGCYSWKFAVLIITCRIRFLHLWSLRTLLSLHPWHASFVCIYFLIILSTPAEPLQTLLAIGLLLVFMESGQKPVFTPTFIACSVTVLQGICN